MICERTEGYQTECLNDDSDGKRVHGKACCGHVFSKRSNKTLHVLSAVNRSSEAVCRRSSIFRWASHALGRFIGEENASFTG